MFYDDALFMNIIANFPALVKARPTDYDKNNN